MEDTLRVKSTKKKEELLGLNPCSNGRYSQRVMNAMNNFSVTVLILVLMEDTLRDSLCLMAQ